MTTIPFYAYYELKFASNNYLVFSRYIDLICKYENNVKIDLVN